MPERIDRSPYPYTPCLHYSYVQVASGAHLTDEYRHRNGQNQIIMLMPTRTGTGARKRPSLENALITALSLSKYRESEDEQDERADGGRRRAPRARFMRGSGSGGQAGVAAPSRAGPEAWKPSRATRMRAPSPWIGRARAGPLRASP
eukprot:scaffold6824_cov118-Isochrysis_galbana.AAC.8